MTGSYPFYNGGNMKKCFEETVNGCIKWPSNDNVVMSSTCKSFIDKCLTKNPENRLGSKDGSAEIIAHPWFSDLSEQDLMDKKFKPKYVPALIDAEND